MSAEFKEVVVDSDRCEAQHLAPEIGQPPLYVVAWGDVFVLQRRPRVHRRQRGRRHRSHLLHPLPQTPFQITHRYDQLRHSIRRLGPVQHPFPHLPSFFRLDPCSPSLFPSRLLPTPSVPVHRQPRPPPHLRVAVHIRVGRRIRSVSQPPQHRRQRRAQHIKICPTHHLPQRLQSVHLGTKLPFHILPPCFPDAAHHLLAHHPRGMDDTVDAPPALLDLPYHCRHRLPVGHVGLQHQHLAAALLHPLQALHLLHHLAGLPLTHLRRPSPLPFLPLLPHGKAPPPHQRHSRFHRFHQVFRYRQPHPSQTPRDHIHTPPPQPPTSTVLLRLPLSLLVSVSLLLSLPSPCYRHRLIPLLPSPSTSPRHHSPAPPLSLLASYLPHH